MSLRHLWRPPTDASMFILSYCLYCYSCMLYYIVCILLGTKLLLLLLLVVVCILLGTKLLLLLLVVKGTPGEWKIGIGLDVNHLLSFDNPCTYIGCANIARCLFIAFAMMTSSNGNIFRVTGHLCGEFTGHRWIPDTKASDAELWCFLWSAPWINGGVNTREAGDLRRHRAHCDVTVMFSILEHSFGST